MCDVEAIADCIGLGVILMGVGPVDPAPTIPVEGELEVEVGDGWLVIFVWGTTRDSAHERRTRHARDRPPACRSAGGL